MQVKFIDTYFDPSLGGKNCIRFETGKMHVHRARAHKALSYYYYYYYYYYYWASSMLIFGHLKIWGFL